jgi:hypothetical protein
MLPALQLSCHFPAHAQMLQPSRTGVPDFFAMAIRMMSLITGGGVGSIWMEVQAAVQMRRHDGIIAVALERRVPVTIS